MLFIKAQSELRLIDSHEIYLITEFSHMNRCEVILDTVKLLKSKYFFTEVNKHIVSINRLSVKGQMGRCKSVMTDVILKICEASDCNVEDIMECVLNILKEKSIES